MSHNTDLLEIVHVVQSTCTVSRFSVRSCWRFDRDSTSHSEAKESHSLSKKFSCYALGARKDIPTWSKLDSRVHYSHFTLHHTCILADQCSWKRKITRHRRLWHPLLCLNSFSEQLQAVHTEHVCDMNYPHHAYAATACSNDASKLAAFVMRM